MSFTRLLRSQSFANVLRRTYCNGHKKKGQGQGQGQGEKKQTDVLKPPPDLKPPSDAKSTEKPSRGIYPNVPRYKKLMEMQTLFCRDDGKLVWQKRGSVDVFLYYSTIGLAVLGLVLAVNLIYKLIVPRCRDPCDYY